MELENATTATNFANWIVRNGYIVDTIHPTHICWKKAHPTLINLMLPEGTTEDLFKIFIKTQ